MSELKIGDKVPDFTLQNDEGKTVNLYRVLEKNHVILFFYPKNNTPGCVKETCSFRDNYEGFKEYPVTILGISGDSAQSHSAFSSKYELPFTLLSDKGNKVRKKMGVPSSLFGLLPGRVTYIIDQNARIQLIISNQFYPHKHVEQSLAYFKERPVNQ